MTPVSDSHPWAVEYDQFGIPETLEPYPDRPVHHLLEDAADEYPEQGVIQAGHEKVAYPEVDELADRLARALADRGVGKGDRVATVLPTSLAFAVVAFGVSKSGAVHVPNDFLVADDDLVYRLEQADPEVLVGVDEERDLLARLADDLDVERVLLTATEAFTGADPDVDLDLDVDCEVEELTDVVADAEPEPPDVAFDVEEDVHTLMFTGGTTGRPKGVQLTHRNLVANTHQAKAVQSQMTDMLVGQAAGVNTLPAYHAYGYLIAHVSTYLAIDQVLVPDPRDAETTKAMLEEHAPLLMTAVPTQYMELMDEGVEESDDVIGIAGAAPLPSETKEAFTEQSKGISQGYGMTEMTAGATFNVRSFMDSLSGQTSIEPAFDQPTVGVPMPDVRVKLRDLDTGEEIPLETAIAEEREGELLLDGPQRMKGYLDGSRAAFDEEGFLETGDVAKVDDRGRLYIVDRVKDMINVSGLKVYSEEVDEALHGHPDVELGATIGVPDPDRPGSEQVKVYVQPTDDADSLTEASVVEYLEGRVPQHAVPAEVTVIEEMPLTAIGKTDKQALREREGAGEESASGTA